MPVVPSRQPGPQETDPTGTAPGAAAAAGAVRPAPRRWLRALAGLVAAVALVTGAGGYAYASHYTDRAVPGSRAGALSLAGMDRQAVTDAVRQRADAVTVTVTGDAQATASLADLGVTVDAEATADAVMTASQRLGDRLGALMTPNDVPPVTSTDPAAAAAWAQALAPDDQSPAVNATVTLNDAGDGFVVVPSATGTGLDTDTLLDAAATAARTLTSQEVTVGRRTIEPAVTDAQAQAVADRANAVVATPVTLSAGDDGEPVSPDAATKASWVVLTDHDDDAPDLSIDAAMVGQWVASQSQALTRDPVTGVRNVNAAGEVLATPVQAVNGTAVTNAEDVTAAVTTALEQAAPYTGELTTQEVEAGWTTRTIADGAEHLAYAAAPGEKWVDINLSARTVTAYEGADVVRGPVSVVDGAPATPTVTGTYHVYLKYASQTMRGSNADGSRYETPGVPWVTYFYQGYAMHGAPWRSTFGYSGSHGCLNMPVAEARWMYDWSEIGTTVVVHR